MIEINNLSKSYGINKIFENESITLTNSCIYALVGVYSGSIVAQLSRQNLIFL